MSFSPLDIVFIVILAIAAIRCVIKGFISEIFTFISVFGGIIAALLLYNSVSVFISKNIANSTWNSLIAFLAIFLIFYLIVKLLERIFINIIDKLSLEKLDQALGLFLGLIEGIFICVTIVLLLQIQPFFEIGELIENSFIGGIIDSILPGPETIIPAVENLHV